MRIRSRGLLALAAGCAGKYAMDAAYARVRDAEETEPPHRKHRVEDDPFDAGNREYWEPVLTFVRGLASLAR